ncbi:hypothetical protein SOV_38060 [Sporomusa ovata DSM 2662]|uniref:PqqD family protein n=1 Tax=Sporomusa ovata TaxID=2378 RepID=A0A0U1KS68_9FIRM|nr:hypothetical protein [Sporomusa ovata]EQB26195.1 hypothetical protein SOV_3c00690 [Sporomusa ovata DSM 2662]CQR70268.1 hypothetical protein SpAn4DRAFT_1237 [Sporomusa ovata]
MFKLRKEIKVSRLYGDMMLLDTRNGTCFNINKTGQIFWDELLSVNNEEEIIINISRKINRSSSELVNISLRHFKDELIKNDLVEI